MKGVIQIGKDTNATNIDVPGGVECYGCDASFNLLRSQVKNRATNMWGARTVLWRSAAPTASDACTNGQQWIDTTTGTRYDCAAGIW